MIKPEKPKNEVQRLKALHNLNILDTKAEERFDRITRVAQNLFRVSIATVSLIDEEREWFKSKCGLRCKETPREISFGGHAILQEDIMVVKDALHDTRFKDNPLVLGGPEIRFYLGCPLKIKGQFNIGTLCLIDHKPQQFTEVDLNIVKDLAKTVEAEFDMETPATTDELTQLSNWDGFLSISKHIIRLGNEYDKNILLIYFDLHKIKLINEHYGHNEGDKTLKIFSQQLLKNFRHSDAVARLGGDKFCVLCSGMSKEHLPNAIKRFQNKLSSVRTNQQIEYSVGSIEYDRRKHFSVNSLIEEAEEKIYEHKRDYH